MTINNWNDLHHFGIFMLTGESCGLSMRLLCDVNAQGIEVLTEFFGGNITFTEGSNWNSKGQASILLPRGIFCELAAFCLIRRLGGTVLVMKNETVQTVTDEQLEAYRSDEKWFMDTVERIFSQSGTAGTRNKHEFSGRTK